MHSRDLELLKRVQEELTSSREEHFKAIAKFEERVYDYEKRM